MGQTNLRIANTNTENYVKTQMGKNHRERESNSTIIKMITIMFSDVLGFWA